MSDCPKCGAPTKDSGRYSPDLGMVMGYESGLEEKQAQLQAAQADIVRLHSVVAELVRTLREIQKGPEPLADYLFGIRCGLEDRNLQHQPYEAAEYGYQQGLDYCADLAAQSLAPFNGGE